MTYRSLFIIALPVLLSACSSTPQRPEGQIDILTTAQGTPLSGAECAVDTGAGSWKVVTPAVVNVGEPRGDLRVVCNRAGFRTSEVLVRGGPAGYTPGSTRVGVGVGGGSWGSHSGVGISLGFGFPLGGVGRTPHYPAQVLVDMTPLPSQSGPQPMPAPAAVEPAPATPTNKNP